MQLTCSPVYSISLFTFNFSQPLPELAYTWTTPDQIGLENRPRDQRTFEIFFWPDRLIRSVSMFDIKNQPIYHRTLTTI